MSWFKSRKIGRFEIEAEIIDEHPDVVLQIMATVIVIGADIAPDRKVIEYVAICEAFDDLDEGSVAPSYDVEYDQDTQEVSWSRQEG